LRSTWTWVFGLLILVSSLVGGSAHVARGAAEGSPVAMLPPGSEPELATLALGASEWVRSELAAAGMPSSDGFALAGSLAPDRQRPLPAPEVLRELGAQSGIGRACAVDLRTPAPGRVVARILLVDLASGRLYAANRQERPLADLGAALASATVRVLEQAGRRVRSGMAPDLAALDRYGRALDHLEHDELADAWRELGEEPTPTATALRNRIERRAQAPSVSLGVRARLAVARGESERARLWVRSELDESDDPELVIAAAEAAALHGSWDRSLAFYQRADSLGASAEATVPGRVRGLIELGRAGEAVALADSSASADPEVLAPLAEQADLDENTRGRLHLRLAAEYGARFDSGRAETHLERVARLAPAFEGPAVRKATLLYARLGDEEQALIAGERAVELGAADAGVWQAVGQARRAMGDSAGARKAFEQARELSPGSVAPLVGLGELALESGDRREGITLLQEAVRSAPGDARARLDIAGARRAAGDLDGALEVIEADDAVPTAELLRAAASIHMERGEVERAGEELTRAVEIQPENGALHAELASVAAARGAGETAEKERQLASLLATSAAGGAAAAAEGGPEGTGPPGAGSLAGLVESFPDSLPGGGAPIQFVALLEVSDAPEPGWSSWLRRLLAPRKPDPEAFGRDLVAALQRRFEVVPPAQIPAELATEDRAVLAGFGGDEATVARVNHALGTDAVFAARIEPAEVETGAGGLRVELRLLVGGEADAVRRFRNDTILADGQRRYASWNPWACGLAVLLLMLGAAPLARGWGELVVGIEYAKVGKGFFSIKLSRRPDRGEVGQQRRQPGQARFLRRLSVMGRYQRAMVGRETHFRFLPARHYYVAVHGLLQDPVTDEVVGNYLAEKPVFLKRGQSARLDFDFRPKECPVEVSVFVGTDPAPQARVAVRGRPDSMIYARDGRCVVYLGAGRHRIVVGLEDRVLERDILIEELSARTLALDANDRTSTVFRDCPEAVEAYVQSDLETAAATLERAGQTVEASRIRGSLYAEQGDKVRAAECLRAAGRLEEAASLLSDGADPHEAGELFEKAGNFEAAGRAFREAGEWARAARALERAYRYEEAVDCYAEAGEGEKVLDLLEKLGRNLEAARSALERGEPDRAIRNLQAVESRAGDYPKACRLLAEILSERGELDLAIQKLEDAVAVSGRDTAPLELLAQLGGVLERAGRDADALELYEAIRARDFHYPEVGNRIEEIRKRLSAERALSSLPGGGGDSRESRYEILEEIGRGGMGVVLKARDRRLGRIVALKRLPENLRNHPTAVRLFLREARAAAALNHPNIVTLYDADQENGVYFITMEYLEGLPLHRILERRHRLTARDAARLGAQVALGLDYAHGRRIVHRDIKTANLFFTGDRVVKIMDFGLAKMLEEVRRAATVVGGTPYYMAPEQAAGEEVDHRADLYSLGITLFELITGAVPFRSGDVTYHHRHTPAPDPREGVPDLPAEMAELVMRLLAKDPDERPASAGEVAQALQRIVRQLAG
jgi:tetratricopeptide (TPR) repeat protein